MKKLLKRFQVVSISSLSVGVLLFNSVFVHAGSNPLNGAEIFNNNCARCHNARSLDEFSFQEWYVIMPHMREKAHLTGKETDAVMEFIALVKSNPVIVADAQLEAPAIDGGKLFTKYSCQGCHSVNDVGGSVGPALDFIIRDKGKSFFLEKLKNPQFNDPASPMPKMPLTDQEINALADYLSELQSEK